MAATALFIVLLIFSKTVAFGISVNSSRQFLDKGRDKNLKFLAFQRANVSQTALNEHPGLLVQLTHTSVWTQCKSPKGYSQQYWRRGRRKSFRLYFPLTEEGEITQLMLVMESKGSPGDRNVNGHKALKGQLHSDKTKDCTCNLEQRPGELHWQDCCRRFLESRRQERKYRKVLRRRKILNLTKTQNVSTEEFFLLRVYRLVHHAENSSKLTRAPAADPGSRATLAFTRGYSGPLRIDLRSVAHSWKKKNSNFGLEIEISKNRRRVDATQRLVMPSCGSQVTGPLLLQPFILVQQRQVFFNSASSQNPVESRVRRDSEIESSDRQTTRSLSIEQQDRNTNSGKSEFKRNIERKQKKKALKSNKRKDQCITREVVVPLEALGIRGDILHPKTVVTALCEGSCRRRKSKSDVTCSERSVCIPSDFRTISVIKFNEFGDLVVELLRNKLVAKCSCKKL